MGKRGKATAGKQLGELEVKILLWLHKHLYHTEHHPWYMNLRGIKPVIRPNLVLKPSDSRGLRWNAKQLYDEPEPTASQASALSRARGALEEDGLIKCYKSGNRTTHAKLTDLGWATADQWWKYGVSERDMKSKLKTPETDRDTYLRRELYRLRGILAKAKGEEADRLAADLGGGIRAIEAELRRLKPAVEKARAEALIKKRPGSRVAKEMSRVLELEDMGWPNFFEAVEDLNDLMQKEKKGLS